MKQPDVSKTEPAKGDYLLARAKRQLEKLLRQEGATKREALEQVHQQFSQPRKESAP